MAVKLVLTDSDRVTALYIFSVPSSWVLIFSEVFRPFFVLSCRLHMKKTPPERRQVPIVGSLAMLASQRAKLITWWDHPRISENSREHRTNPGLAEWRREKAASSSWM